MSSHSAAPTPDQAFTEAFRSHRLEHGHDPDTLPPPLSLNGDPPGGVGDAPSSPVGGGGFMLDDDEDDAGAGGGGFMVDDDGDGERPDVHAHDYAAAPSSDSVPLPEYLPLSEAPHALSILGIPSNDAEILAVLEDGAVDDPDPDAGSGSGLGSAGGARRRVPGAAARPKVITREIFRQVCEVLLEQQQQERGEASDTDRRRRRRRAENAQAQQHDSPASSSRPSRRAAAKQREITQAQLADGSDDSGSDVYAGSSGDDDDDDDDAQEEEEHASSRRRRGGARRTRKASDSDTDSDSSDPSRRRRKRRAVAAKASSDDDDDGAPDPPGVRRSRPAQLSRQQRERVHDAWALLTDKLDEVDPGWAGAGAGAAGKAPGAPLRIGMREIQRLAISVGEKISDSEIEEMLALACSSFAPASSKHVTEELARSARLSSSRGGGGEGAADAKIGIDEFAGVLLRGRMI